MASFITRSGQFLRNFIVELAVFDMREVFMITLAIGGLMLYAYLAGG